MWRASTRKVSRVKNWGPYSGLKSKKHEGAHKPIILEASLGSKVWVAGRKLQVLDKFNRRYLPKLRMIHKSPLLG
jgi:hypothetical protein